MHSHLGTLAAYVFESTNLSRGWRWTKLFCKPERVSRILDSWISKDNSPTAQRTVLDWAIQSMVALIYVEAAELTQGALLRITKREFNTKFMLGLNFDTLGETIATGHLVIICILKSICTMECQEKTMPSKGRNCKHFVRCTLYVIANVNTDLPMPCNRQQRWQQ